MAAIMVWLLTWRGCLYGEAADVGGLPTWYGCLYGGAVDMVLLPIWWGQCHGGASNMVALLPSQVTDTVGLLTWRGY